MTLADGTVVRGEGVLICGGQTPALFGPLGVEFGPHTRVTYAGSDATGAACLSVPEGYGLPLGSTGRWAFGQQVRDPATVRAVPVALARGPGGLRHGPRPVARPRRRRPHAVAASSRSSAAT